MTYLHVKYILLYIFILNLFDMFDLFLSFYIIALPSSLGIPSGKGMAHTFTGGVGGMGLLTRQFAVPKSRLLHRMNWKLGKKMSCILQ